MTASRIPVTLLSGFLGAGKTTLLQRILTQTAGRRIAVIENEFGSVNVDRLLLEGTSNTVFQLQNGCLCCSVYDDLIDALQRMIDRHPDLEHLIIEATGLADPAPVIAGMSAPGIREHFELAGVITMVDAAHLHANLADTEVCARQIALADVLVVNRIDQVPPSALHDLQPVLRSLNPLASYHATTHAQIDVAMALAHHRTEMKATPITHHHHDSRIGSLALEAEGTIDIDAIDQWLGAVVRRHEILRMKGVLVIPNDPRRFVFQGVRQWVDVHPHTEWGDAPKLNQLVFIGRDLHEQALREGFASCVM